VVRCFLRVRDYARIFPRFVRRMIAIVARFHHGMLISSQRGRFERRIPVIFRHGLSCQATRYRFKYSLSLRCNPDIPTFVSGLRCLSGQRCYFGAILPFRAKREIFLQDSSPSSQHFHSMSFTRSLTFAPRAESCDRPCLYVMISPCGKMLTFFLPARDPAVADGGVKPRFTDHSRSISRLFPFHLFSGENHVSIH